MLVADLSSVGKSSKASVKKEEEEEEKKKEDKKSKGKKGNKDEEAKGKKKKSKGNTEEEGTRLIGPGDLAVACWYGEGAKGKSLSVLASKAEGSHLLYQLRESS